VCFAGGDAQPAIKAMNATLAALKAGQYIFPNAISPPDKNRLEPDHFEHGFIQSPVKANTDDY
jgi:hypothetical protein